jgi:hypothetical protein
MISLRIQLDREEAAIIEGRGRGLGLLNGDDWYGGRIQQIIKVFIKKDGDVGFKILPLEMRRSTRLARFLGSSSIIQLRLHKTVTREQHQAKVFECLGSQLRLHDKAFVMFPPKDNTIYAVEARAAQTTGSMLSYAELLEWHNPVELNCDQVCLNSCS